MTIQDIEKEIVLIKLRNKKVESEKAWETSLFRRVSIAVLTYVVVLLFFIVANLEGPLLNALIATVGFLLSNLSLSILKRFWRDRIYKD